MLAILWIMFSIQRKPKISASRKLMLKVREIMDLFLCQTITQYMCLTTGEQQRSCPELLYSKVSHWSRHKLYFHIWFLFVQSLMVAKAKEELEQEVLVKEEEKQKYLAERAPPLNTSGLSLAQLQVTRSQIPWILPQLCHFSLPPLALLLKKLHLNI